METTWIIVASREDVRIFSRQGHGHIQLEREIGNPTGRLKLQDLVSDRSGASSDNRMRRRPAYATEESPRERAVKDFYREVCEELDKALSKHRFNHLVFIAEPRLLGYLRGMLSKNLAQSVTREIAKDLSAEKQWDIEGRL